MTIFDNAYWIWEYTANDKYREIKGVVNAINDTDQVSMSHAVLINTLYELEAWCTSIVAQMANGTIIHSRNLDFHNTGKMRDITFRARFVKNGEEKFDAVMFAGNVGIYTGIKKGAYSVS